MHKTDYSIIGKKFDRLTVLEFDHVNRHGSYFLCRCDCGNQKIVSYSQLKSGATGSCGCKAYESRHTRRSPDLTGRRFGKLYVLGFDRMDHHSNSYWLCECDCGNITTVSRVNLLNGSTTSCGCWHDQAHITHGMSYDQLYNVWHGMKQRCTNIHHTAFHHYGGRGIAICTEWMDFENFRDWALNNGYRPGLTIDRINTNDGYCPENCRWVSQLVQCNNKRNNHFVTYNGVTHTIADWSRILGVKYGTLQNRINRDDMRDFEEYFGK